MNPMSKPTPKNDLQRSNCDHSVFCNSMSPLYFAMSLKAQHDHEPHQHLSSTLPASKLTHRTFVHVHCPCPCDLSVGFFTIFPVR
eukprot:5886888-Amphidinium_carterae.1